MTDAPEQTAADIAAHALASRENYEEMAAQEARVWSHVQTDERIAQLRKDEQAAAASLDLNRHSFHFQNWLRQEGLSFEHGLSVGCGEGRAEREYVQKGMCAKFTGVDIAEDSIALAIEENKKAGMDNTYRVADVNFADFGENEFDFILAQTSLHHLVHLEDVADAIHKALKPDGVLFMHDFVGESQFQWSAERRAHCETAMAFLPDSYLESRLNNRRIHPIPVPKPGKLISPFESIRSADILPVFDERFERVAGGTYKSILNLVVPMGCRQHYVQDEQGRALFEAIVERDRVLIEQDILTGCEAKIVYRKRAD